MKTIIRTSLPTLVKYNGRVYTLDTSLDKDFLIDRKENLRIALESTGKVVMLVKVLSRRLRGKTDLGDIPYKPSQFLFTAPKDKDYFKVRIVKHTPLQFGNKEVDAFHKDMVGHVILVKKTEHDGAYYECKTGDSILKDDCALIVNQK